MKRFSSIILISILLAILLISCEKQLFDYRNKYIGNWRFDVSNSHEWIDLNHLDRGWYDTTVTNSYHGQIKYGTRDISILFQSDSISIEFPLHKDGTIIPENDLGLDYSESGGFEGKKIFRYHYYHHWGGSHQYIRTEIFGEKE
jgi:hypothetical protein